MCKYLARQFSNYNKDENDDENNGDDGDSDGDSEGDDDGDHGDNGKHLHGSYHTLGTVSVLYTYLLCCML